MSKFKYTKEDVLREMAEALGESEPKTAQPNLLKGLIARTRLGKGKEKVS